MKSTALIFSLVFNILFFSNLAHGANLRSGDLILISLNCRSCPKIESETGSPYSHSGLLIQENNQWVVLEALGTVKKTPLAKFKKYVRPGTKPHHYRLKEWKQKDPDRNQKLLDRFQEDYEGKPFDGLYLWNNFDNDGNELLYCSEMITKLLNEFLNTKVPTEPMDFTENWDYWERVYNGNVPQGEPGNSPSTFAEPFLSDFLGEL
jgi:hypothetical protein